MGRNTTGVLFASAARALAQAYNSSDVTNYNGKGVRIFISVSAASATPSVVPTLQVKDPITGNYSTVLTGVAITGTGDTVLTLYPGATVAANVTLSNHIGKVFRLVMTHADTDSITYTASYTILI